MKNSLIIYSLHVGHMTPGENQTTLIVKREDALEWWRHEVVENTKYMGRVQELYSHWHVEELDHKWLEEVGPQTMAWYYAEHRDGTVLVSLEAHLIYNI